MKSIKRSLSTTTSLSNKSTIWLILLGVVALFIIFYYFLGKKFGIREGAEVNRNTVGTSVSRGPRSSKIIRVSNGANPLLNNSKTGTKGINTDPVSLDENPIVDFVSEVDGALTDFNFNMTNINSNLERIKENTQYANNMNEDLLKRLS